MNSTVAVTVVVTRSPSGGSKMRSHLVREASHDCTLALRRLVVETIVSHRNKDSSRRLSLLQIRAHTAPLTPKCSRD